MKEINKRDGFSGTFGVIAATAGSAIGLGNIWRFPYVAGENGGGAFMLIYLIFVLGIGVPVMLSEMIIGRKAGTNALRSFKKLAPKSSWWVVGLIGIIAAFIILAFYGTVAGWTMEYLFSSIRLNLLGQNYTGHFENLMSGTTKPIFWHIMFMFLTAIIVIAGVQKGIEKYSKFLMPLLFIIIIILCIRSVTLPGAAKGLEFLFKPDFSKLTSQTILSALGQAFFSLSIGMGTLITYASYVNKKENLTFIAISVSMADTILAILAGIMIFPAVFAFGIAPGSGPGLVFITLPSIFEQIPWGSFFAILFFLLLVIAALTSSISLLEVIVAYFVEELKIKRKLATIISSIAAMTLGAVCTLSWSSFKNIYLNITSKVNGSCEKMQIFDIMDFAASNILLPLGGLLIVIFVGWVLKKKVALLELSNYGTLHNTFLKIVFFVVKYIAPIAIAIVFLNGIGLI